MQPVAASKSEKALRLNGQPEYLPGFLWPAVQILVVVVYFPYCSICTGWFGLGGGWKFIKKCGVFNKVSYSSVIKHLN